MYFTKLKNIQKAVSLYKRVNRVIRKMKIIILALLLISLFNENTEAPVVDSFFGYYIYNLWHSLGRIFRSMTS